MSAPPRVGGFAALTLSEATERIRRGQLSPVELTEACLKRIDSYNPALNAFVTIAREQALEAARQLEQEQRRHAWRGPLHGIPIALKDNIDTAGIRTTGASALFKDRIPDADAYVVAKLRAAGAIVLGKLNMHEFALGGTSAVTYFGPVHNPWAMDHHPGGSWTFDTVGPMCKTVEDAALMLAVIAGYDALDPTSVNAPLTDYTRAVRMGTRKLRVGVPRTPFYDGLQPAVAAAMDAAVKVVRDLVGDVREVQLPRSPGLGAVSNAEIYAYHAPWITKTPELYQEATRRIVMNGANTRSESYIQGLRQVELGRREIAKVFAAIDVLITPTTTGVTSLIPPPAASSPAPTAAAGPAPAGGGAPGFRNTSYFSFYGLPAISVPCGVAASGLPIGLQISGNHFAESTVLALAHAYEQATEWHKRRPSLST